MTPPPDLRDLLAQAQQVQQRIAEVQRDVARRTVEASSGGGMVKAVATGELRIAAVHIEPELAASGDRTMLQDLVTAAVNAALAAAQRMVAEAVQRAAGAPIPGLGVAPGGGPGSPGGSGNPGTSGDSDSQ